MKKVIFLLLISMIALKASAQKPVVEHYDNYTARGIRGLFDVGKNYGGDFSSTLVSAAYGLQADSQNFWGGGLTLEWGGDVAIVGVFADYRYEVLDNKLSPFLDVRAGAYFTGDGAGFLFNPAIGLRYGSASLSMGLGAGMGANSFKGFQIRFGLDFGGRVK